MSKTLNKVLTLVKELSYEERSFLRRKLAQEEFKKGLREIRKKLPDIPEEEIVKDVTEAIKEARRSRNVKSSD
jgi:ribosome-binding protein aMBF1 (putative translation factor)